MLRTLSILLAVLAFGAVGAAPFRPVHDGQVLVELPGTSNAAARELRQWRRQLALQPRDAILAERVAQRHLEVLGAEGDPRDAGLARSALAPWWNEAAPPPPLRLQRAVLRQFSHDFDGARADLRALVAADAGHAEAWSWLAAIALVQARWSEAREACNRLPDAVTELHTAACHAAVDALTGRARAAVDSLRQALVDDRDAPAPQRQWALTRLAETLGRLGEHAAAEEAFRAALALGLDDSYLRAAFADFLLDRGRPLEVIALLAGRERNDLHLLRLAIAGPLARHERAAAWRAAMAARFDDARLRGDSAHQKEEARFALQVLGDARRALPLAQANFRVQREPADARILLEAAIAAREPAAARPALEWRRESHIESRVLDRLAAQALQ